MQNDHIAANLPSKNFTETIKFYQSLGFEVQYQSEQWLILQRGHLQLEFFPYPALDPSNSYFSASVWVHDLDALYTAWQQMDWQHFSASARMTELQQQGDLRIFNVIDCHGSLLRCMAL